MSETEINVGKLVPVPMEGTIEETCRAILQREFPGWEWMEYSDGLENLNEAVNDGPYYFAHDDKLYRVEMEIEDTTGGYDIDVATLNPDGTISFVLQYYNGGCSFDEAMADAMGKLRVPDEKDQESRVLPICTAYEQGYGDGYQGKLHKQNPYAVGSDCAWAWDYGKAEGIANGNPQ